jgi:hypothetical protein
LHGSTVLADALRCVSLRWSCGVTSRLCAPST